MITEQAFDDDYSPRRRLSGISEERPIHAPAQSLEPTLLFYPRVLEPQTGSTDLEWVQACGLGTVYSATVIRPKPPALPYNVSLVDLDEGPRMMTRIEGMPAEQVTIGLRVKARIVEEVDQFFVVFDPHHH